MITKKHDSIAEYHLPKVLQESMYSNQKQQSQIKNTMKSAALHLSMLERQFFIYELKSFIDTFPQLHSLSINLSEDSNDQGGTTVYASSSVELDEDKVIASLTGVDKLKYENDNEHIEDYMCSLQAEIEDKFNDKLYDLFDIDELYSRVGNSLSLDLSDVINSLENELFSKEELNIMEAGKILYEKDILDENINNSVKRKETVKI